MASTYTQLKLGSTGKEVNALQTALNNKGYSLQNTGIFDDATEKALRQYQTDYGLDVDGVAGESTLGSLYGTNTNATGGYTPSAKVIEAQKYAESVQQQKPGEYQSAYTQQMQEQFDAIMNRKPFSYDAASDPMFMQASDRYVQQGRRAMQDTMARSAELTGGYGNSYAQGAGQAAYGAYLQDLSALAPEYMNAAYTRYQGEGADMQNRYNMMANREDEAYARYQDKMDAYYREVDRARQEANQMYEREYGQYMDQQNAASADREYAYSTAMLMLQGGKMPSAELLATAGISDADAAALLAMYTPVSKGGSGSGGGSKEEKKSTGTDTKVIVNPATYEKSSVENLKEGIENGSIKVTDTDVEDGILSFKDWTANQKQADPFAAAKQGTASTLRDIGKQAAADKEAYQEYVAQTIESDYLSKKITKKQATNLMEKYLMD